MNVRLKYCLRDGELSFGRRIKVDGEFDPILLNLTLNDIKKTEEFNKVLNPVEHPCTTSIYIQLSDNYKVEKFHNFQNLSPVELEVVFIDVCEYFKVDSDTIRKKTRKRLYSDMRKIGSAVSYVMSTASLDRIGTIYGGYDHATVLYNIREAFKLYSIGSKKFVEAFDHFDMLYKRNISELLKDLLNNKDLRNERNKK